MNKLTVVKGLDKYEIILQDYKMIYGLNYNIKFDILRTILRFYKNNKSSEYAVEENNVARLYINDKEVKPKDILVFHVNKHYSIIDDFKLSTKSLISKYLETLLSNESFFDTINTLNILFESLSQEITIESSVSGCFNTMVPKQLIKLLTPQYLENDISKDEYDLSLEEIILFQLNLIDYINKHDNTINHIIICIELPKLTETIYSKIKEMKNCYILIFTDLEDSQIEDISKYYLCENKILDLADENQVFNLICDNNYKLLTLKEGREYVEKYIFEKEHEKARFIMDLLT